MTIYLCGHVCIDEVLLYTCTLDGVSRRPGGGKCILYNLGKGEMALLNCVCYYLGWYMVLHFLRQACSQSGPRLCGKAEKEMGTNRRFNDSMCIGLQLHPEI